jgi:thiol-disulfide isomerase/thioredoxin
MKARLVLNVLILTCVFVCVAIATYIYEQKTPPRQSIIEASPLNSIKEETGPISTVPLISIDKSSMTVNDGTISLSDYQGKIIVLNLWASWCAPCQIEFPALLSLAEKHENDIVFVALSSDTELPKLERFLRTQNEDQLLQENVIMTWDKTRTVKSEHFNTYKLPETIIIDQSGQKTHRISGVNWSEIDISRIIQSTIDRSKKETAPTEDKTENETEL